MPSELNDTEKSILEAAGQLFMKHGIRRVSVEEISREAGLSKMTFYKYFANKADVAKAFLLHQSDKAMQGSRQVMGQPIPFAEKVKQIIRQKMDDTEGISQEFVKDIFQDERLGLQEVIKTMRKNALDEMLAYFKEAANNGEMRKDIHPQFIAYFLDKINEMAADEKLLKLYKNEQALIMELTNFFFYGLGIKHEK